MKARIYLHYRDNSEVCFNFECDEEKNSALATLLMVCRGTLTASMGIKIYAYDENGSCLCAYYK